MNEYNWLPTLISLVGGGAFATIAVALINRRKTNAEAKDISLKGEFRIVDAAGALADSMRKELERQAQVIAQLQQDMAGVKRTNRELQREIDELRTENRSLKARCSHLEEENERLKKGE